MKLEQNGQSFDLITDGGKAMHLVRRAGMRSEEFIGHAQRFAVSDELLAALEAMNAVATFPQWDAGDCRLCKYDFATGHAPDCKYAQAEALMIAAIQKARG